MSQWWFYEAFLIIRYELPTNFWFEGKELSHSTNWTRNGSRFKLWLKEYKHRSEKRHRIPLKPCNIRYGMDVREGQYDSSNFSVTKPLPQMFVVLYKKPDIYSHNLYHKRDNKISLSLLPRSRLKRHAFKFVYWLPNSL